ncbi:MAG: hypothetical protein D4R64_06925 [Porphyromonadaceae bacterium]|nr:MAG: hypothetical protein D4R64_06925 [Porphyromonadaceae bacterium]
MRPICFITLVLFLAPVRLVAQDPMATAMRTTDWPAALKAGDGIGWSVFSKQYYFVSNWNATGLSVDYTSAMGQSAALICRDGIPGFSWYHLYLSHYGQFKKISGMLQLRFSLIDLKDRPTVFRLGGNIRTTWSMSQTLMLQVSLYDFTGWILPVTAIARGDPAMQFLLFHEPGRLIGLASGFQVSRAQFGPVTAGIRVNINDQIGLIGLFDVLPFGITLGVGWKLKGYRINGWIEHRNGIGLTPMVEISSD